MLTKGFTLIEVLAAIVIITLGAGAAFTLLQQSIAFTAVASSQLEASYLASEGMEIVRNIRDSNLLSIHKGNGGAWDDGLTGCESGCQADYASTSLSSFQDTFLQYSGGLYSYTASTDSPYKRKITIAYPSLEMIEVSVEVTWEERGRSHSVTVASELYNWLPSSQ